MPLLGLHVEPVGADPLLEMPGMLAGVGTHGVQVGGGNRPALGLKRRRSFADEMGVEGLRLRVRKNEMGMHEGTS